MREADFKAWLEARRWNGKPLTSVGNRMSKARRFERSMRSLGLPYGDLDQAYEADGMASVTDLLRLLCKRATETGEAPQELVGESTIPAQRMNNLASAVRNYRQFRDDEHQPPPTSAWPALDELKAGFLDRVPDFERFTKTDNGYERIEREYKDRMAADFRAIVDSQDTDDQAGKRIYRALMPNSGPLLRWQIDDDFHRKHPQLAPAFYGAIAQLARSTDTPADAIMHTADALQRLRGQGATALTVGQIAGIAVTVAGFARPQEAAPFKMSKARELAALLTGDPIFRGPALERDQVVEWLDLLARIREVMRDDWGWEPRDLFDVQGFAWAALDDNWEVEEDEEAMEVGPRGKGEATDEEKPSARPISSPTNLILYGPPGTGKTYATAAEAIRLCGEDPPADRADLMMAYRRLSDAGRIEFVTFHQSIAYEDFVEGLRPSQSGDDGAAGFELKPEQGVFRRIARRAETSTGPGIDNFSIQGRQVFKMSLGDATDPDEAYLFEEAIENGTIILGFGDIDWSEPKYAERDEIMTACRARASDQSLTAQSAVVQMPNIFRNWMREGDLVIVSKGTKLFRAIGVITGGYRFAPREGGGYAHQRDVEWLWIDRAGVPVEEIYARGFSMRTTYLMFIDDLKVPALERYANSQQDTGEAAPESFALVIDEINRANISKVFGELITLLEPDKRLGQPNALKVRLPYSGDVFGVPANLHIVGTMNTADRSIALLDTALRRRFEFRELMPEPSLLDAVDGIDLAKLLTTINERIEYLFDREHQIGHAYFMGCRTRSDVDEVMRHKVVPLLAEYFYEDWAKVAAVLGDGDDGEGSREGRFIDRVRLAVPAGMEGGEDAAPRYRWRVRESFSYDEFSAG